MSGEANVRDMLSNAMREAIAQYGRRGGMDEIDMRIALTAALKMIELAIADATGDSVRPDPAESERRDLAATLVASGTIANMVLLSHLVAAFLCEVSRPLIENIPRAHAPARTLA